MKNISSVAIACVLVLTACGGGSGSVSNTPGDSPPNLAAGATPPAVDSSTPVDAVAGSTAVAPTEQAPVIEVKKLTGTVAIGAALAKLPVVIKDASGNSPCTETSITTDDIGSYQCTLKTPVPEAPYFIRVTDITGTTTDLYSVVTDKPSGSAVTANVTPLTTAILAQSAGINASDIFDDPRKFVKADFVLAKNNITNQIKSVTDSIGLNNYDPFSTPIIAGTVNTKGNTADYILDIVKVVKNANQDYAIKVLGSDVSVDMASKSKPGVSASAPLSNIESLSKYLQSSVAIFQSCTALPANKRVLRDANGKYLGLANACTAIVSKEDASKDIPAFKQYGQPLDWYFWEILDDKASTDVWINSNFMVPEIMGYYLANTNYGPKASYEVKFKRDRAWINIKMFNADRTQARNFITVVENFGTATNANWQITGDQAMADRRIVTQISRKVRFDGSPSRYGSELAIRVNSKMPGSELIDLVRVNGPGLPTSGLWYTNYNGSSLYTMSIYRGDTAQKFDLSTQVYVGTIAFITSQTSIQPPYSDEEFDYQEKEISVGIQSSAYMYARGNIEGSYNYFNDCELAVPSVPCVARPKAGDFYKFTFYKNEKMVGVEFDRLNSDLIKAAAARNMAWNSFDPALLEIYFDPKNATTNPKSGTLDSLLLRWTQNPNAERIDHFWVSQIDGDYRNSTPLPVGATSIIAKPMQGTSYTSLGVPLADREAPYNGYRDIGWQYRMMDGSTKASKYIAYPAYPADPQGIWNNKDSTGNPAVMAVLENGETWGLLYDSADVSGAIYGMTTATGSNSVTSTLTKFYFAKSAGLPETAVGTVTTKGLMTLNSSTPAATFIYNPEYDKPATAAAIAGNWALQRRALTTSSSALSNITIDATGVFSVNDVNCLIKGNIIPRPGGKNLYNVSVSFSGTGCGSNGTLTGVGRVDTSVSPNQFISIVLNPDKSSGAIFGGRRQ